VIEEWIESNGIDPDAFVNLVYTLFILKASWNEIALEGKQTISMPPSQINFWYGIFKNRGLMFNLTLKVFFKEYHEICHVILYVFINLWNIFQVCGLNIA
jgi:hypothetical protein